MKVEGNLLKVKEMLEELFHAQMGFRAVVQFHRDGAMVFRVPPEVMQDMGSVGEEFIRRMLQRN